MIITNVLGGLGNQMFQFAAGLGVSLRTGNRLLVDISGFRGYSRRNYGLDRDFFGIPTVASPIDVRRVLGIGGVAPVRRILSGRWARALRPQSLVIEPSLSYCQELLSVQGPAYLQGYWQSAAYFADCTSAVRSAFSFRNQPLGTAAEWAATIRDTVSVSVHVRRGDYVSSANANAFHGTLPLSYYERATTLIQSLHSDVRFFVFSDDLDWARAHLSFIHDAYFVDGRKGATAHRDLQLMTLCQHSIIANSSLSWWGAWLGRKSHQTIIAPRQWFRNSSIEGTGRIPDEWTLL